MIDLTLVVRLRSDPFGEQMYLASILWSIVSATAKPVVPAGQPGEPSGVAPRDPGAAPTAEPGPSGAQTSFETVLRAAKERHFAGESAAARNLLMGLRQRLEAGENPGVELAVEAMTYLGEIHHKLDEREEARAAFRWILERDPETPISPFHHSFDVVNLFDLVRAEVLRERQEVPDPIVTLRPGPAPLWTLAPLGLPQLAQRRPGAFLFFGGMQAGFGVASLVVYRDMKRKNLEPANSAEAVERQRRRFALQWPLTFAFYGSWALSAVDASGSWRKGRMQPQVGVGVVGEGSPGIQFAGSF